MCVDKSVAGMAGVILESALLDIAALVRRRGLEPPAVLSDDERATFDPALKLAAGRLRSSSSTASATT